MGVLSQICIIDFDASSTRPENYEQKWFEWVSNETAWYISPELGTYIMCGNSSGAGKCPEGTTCLAVSILFLQCCCCDMAFVEFVLILPEEHRFDLGKAFAYGSKLKLLKAT